MYQGAQKTYDRVHTGFWSTYGVTLSRVIIKRSYSNIILPFVEYRSRMASSKTSQGEGKWDKHGMQMCLMRSERK